MATKPIPIKQDLFSFITSRGIEPISYQDKEKSLIKHPDIAKSQFLKSHTAKRSSKSKTELKGINSYLELRELNPALFDLSTQIDRIDTLTVETFEGIEPLKKENEFQIWDYLFADLVQPQSSRNRKALTQIIKTNFIATYIHKDVELTELTKRKILIPIQIIELIKLNLRDCSKELIGVNEIGVIEFRKVEQEVCCYVPGEVSHIENVLAREYKEKHTRDLLRTELTIESETETEVENVTDTSTTTRNELNSEIERTLEEERSSNYGGSLSVHAKFGDSYSLDANAYADFSNSNSSSVSNSVAKNFAQEVTRKAVEKIVRKTKLKRTSKILKEFETNNRHGFDNREGDEHVTGIYRWVDQIFTNRLVNYGKRLVYKFTIPHPSEFYKMAINFKRKQEGENGDGLTPPKTLEGIGLTSAEIITRENYKVFGDEYGVELPEPQENMISKPKHYSGNTEFIKDEHRTTTPDNIPIDPDYVARKVKGHFSISYTASRSRGNWADFFYNIGSVEDGEWNLRGGKDQSFSENFDKNINNSTTVPVHFKYRSTHSYSISFTIYCYLKPDVFEEWQNNVFSIIKQAYDEKYSEYERKLEEQKEKQALAQEVESNSSSNNPLDNRIIEQRELKRACIEMMMKPFCKKLGRDFTDERSCGEYKVAQTLQTPQYAEYIKYVAFFEKAFDWDKMSYVFHPYYWADCKNWVDLIQTKNVDRIFQAFLQAGIAEVVVPVKCEMSLGVAYYMETGDIMNPGDLVPEDIGDYYVSLAKEMENCQKEKDVEGTWDSRVPTSLTILQKDSALIDEAGLPCCLVEEDGCCERMKDKGYENTIDSGKDEDGNSKYKLLEAKKSE